MKKKELTFSQSMALSWYNLEPHRFDTAGNNDWYLIYAEKWLGLKNLSLKEVGNIFIHDRVSKMTYESFRRAVQWLIQNDYIKLSSENMKKRHRAEVETRETILNRPTPNKTLVFLTDSLGNRSEAWI